MTQPASAEPVTLDGLIRQLENLQRICTSQTPVVTSDGKPVVQLLWDKARNVIIVTDKHHDNIIVS
jgi:hypothetical protein